MFVCSSDFHNLSHRVIFIAVFIVIFFPFGWGVWDVDGHDVDMISRAVLDYDEEQKPIAVIANTIKGKGIFDIENDMFAWHHRAPNEEEYKNIIKDGTEIKDNFILDRSIRYPFYLISPKSNKFKCLVCKICCKHILLATILLEFICHFYYQQRTLVFVTRR